MGFKNLNNQLKENKTADEFVNSARGETEEAVVEKKKPSRKKLPTKVRKLALPLYVTEAEFETVNQLWDSLGMTKSSFLRYCIFRLQKELEREGHTISVNKG